MNELKEFLFQLTIIAIPIFTYHTFFNQKMKNFKYKKLVMALLWGLSVIICMSNPVRYGQGHTLDIRLVPLLLGTLSGRYATGVFLSALVLLYRVFGGIDIAFYNTVFVLLFSVPLFLYFQKPFERANKKNKFIVAALLSIFYNLLGISFFTITHGLSFDNIKVQATQMLFVLIAILFFITLSESIKELHHLRSEIEKTEKLKVIGDLTSVFAHEIRNPLQVSRGFLQLLDTPELLEKKKGYIKTSIEELDRANGIITDLLSLGKPSQNIDERIDVALKVQRVINLMQVYTSPVNVDIKTTRIDSCYILGDSQRFSQCVINILKNAIESMPTGGTVWISCTSKKDGHIEICIKDEGIGMTKEQIEKLGSPYYSLKDSGTGLGMMVSLQIIHSFRGTVQVTSKKDIGTEFKILFPQLRT